SAFREGFRTLAAGLALLLVLPLLDRPNYLQHVASATLFGTGFGLVTRLTAWYWKGSWIDAFCGAAIGAVVGGFLGGIIGSVVFGLLFAGRLKGSETWIGAVVLGTVGTCLLAGAVINAARSVTAGRKTDRTVRPA